MSRQARNTPGGMVYHVLNRANGRLRLFRKDEDFLAAVRRVGMEPFQKAIYYEGENL